jgi:hypothetical protein
VASIFGQFQAIANSVYSQVPRSTSISSSSGTTRTVSRSTPSGGGATTAAKPSLDRDVLAQQYGFTLSFLNAYPEVGALFDQAVKEGWSADMFQARFKNSNWYKSMSDSQRKAALLSQSDPAEWSALWNRTQNHVIQMMSDAGAFDNNWDHINAIAGKIIWEGWNDERARQEVGQWVVFGPNGMAGGKAGETQQELNQYAYNMGVKNSDQWMQDSIRSVMSGRDTTQSIKAQIANQAMAAFPSLSDQIKAGATVADLAQPYMQSMGQILELNPGEVNLFDPTIRNALGWKDSTGKAAAKPLWQFQNDLRSDDRWKSTKNAQDAIMGTAHSVLQQFGIYS